MPAWLEQSGIIVRARYRIGWQTVIQLENAAQALESRAAERRWTSNRCGGLVVVADGGGVSYSMSPWQLQANLLVGFCGADDINFGALRSAQSYGFMRRGEKGGPVSISVGTNENSK